MGIQDLKEKFVKFSTVFLSRGEGLSEYNGLVSWDFENVCACLGVIQRGLCARVRARSWQKHLKVHGCPVEAKFPAVEKKTVSSGRV